MNNLVCIGDCHLGYRHRFKTKRLYDYVHAFEDAVAKALKFEPDVILFTGDVVHQSRPDPVTMRKVIQTLMKLAEKTQILICVGNHEIEGHLSTTYTPIYAELHRNIHVLTSEKSHVRLNLIGRQVDFYGFEYTRNRNAAESKLTELSKNITSGYNILCLHQAIEKYLSPFEISSRALREAAGKYNLILLGHVHKHQPVKEVFDITPAYYVGSTERISFNEAANPTGFMLFRNLDPTRAEYIHVDSASMRHIRQNLGVKTPEELNQHIEKTITENQNVQLLQIDANATINGDYLNVRQDWAENHHEYTILDVNINPLSSENQFMMEKINASEDTIREYFQKTGQNNKELEETCVKLYQKYVG
jgi:DNA repair exonuclease SbcCD nuclease subunit